MPATLELRRRIRSVRSTRQITKAMELVASAKMRKSSEAAIASRPYSSALFDVLANLLPLEHPLLQQREVKRRVVVAIASDRGLAGVYNTAVLKKSLQIAEDALNLGQDINFLVMGRKVEIGLVRSGLNVSQSYPHTPTRPTPRDIRPLTQAVVDGFLFGQFDSVHLLYTHFHSILRQEVILLPLLPLLPPPIHQKITQTEFLYEPNPTAVLDGLLPRIVEIQLYQALLESLASEHSSRRMAMRNATDNANYMIDDLTLTYNSLRQSSITQEISEITGGANALSV